MSTDPQPGIPAPASMSTADAIPAPEPSGATAPEAAAASATAPATAPPAHAPAAAEPTPAAAQRSRLEIVVLGRRLLRLTFGLVLLVSGGYAGYRAYETNRPAPVIPGDPTIFDTPAPAVVRELATAIDAGDADFIRSALTPEMFGSYTSELERFGFAAVDSVETLGSYTVDLQTATALILLGRSADQFPVTMNLVVVTENGQIVRLR